MLIIIYCCLCYVYVAKNYLKTKTTAATKSVNFFADYTNIISDKGFLNYLITSLSRSVQYEYAYFMIMTMKCINFLIK